MHVKSASAAIAAVLVLTATAAARAADDSQTMFDVAFGAAVTTDYISRGITQTDHHPAVQGYVELDPGIFYAGIWASNVDFAGARDAELDLSLGVRPELGKASFDFGYVQYVYPGDASPDYGELYGMVSYDATSKLNVGTKIYYAPDYSQSGAAAVYGEANAKLELPHDFSLSGAVGYQSFASSLGLPDYVTWNAGISWTLKDTVKFDLRYSDSNLSAGQCDLLMAANACGARLIASVSFDTSLSSLKGGK